MLRDILDITKKNFSIALNKKRILDDPKSLYDVYIKLANVRQKVSLVSNHYLPLDFTEDYLQNSSYGEPIDKWRFVLNNDLEYLNKAIKEYLFSLAKLRCDDHHLCIVYSYFKPLIYTALVEDYRIGFIKDNESILNIKKIDTKSLSEKWRYFQIDLSTFEKRKELHFHLIEKNYKLKNELDKVKKYMMSKYTLDNLLYINLTEGRKRSF